MFDLLPSKRRGEVPSVFSEMDDLLQKMWIDFPFHNLAEDVDLSWSPRLDVSETDKPWKLSPICPGWKKRCKREERQTLSHH